MSTTDKIMALANTYAASYGKALLEKLYGTSQSYTEQCEAEAFKNREALLAEIEALVRDAERYRWLYGYCRSTPEHWGGRWSIVIEGPCPKTQNSKDDFDAAIDAAMQEKQS